LLRSSGTPADEDVPIAGRLASSRQRRFDAVRDEMERRAALHHERLTCVMREDENRHVVGRVRTPPAGPGVRTPWTGPSSEHAAAHDHRADALELAPEHVVVETRFAALIAVHLAKRLQRVHPFVQALAAAAERVLEALIRPR